MYSIPWIIIMTQPKRKLGSPCDLLAFIHVRGFLPMSLSKSYQRDFFLIFRMPNTRNSWIEPLTESRPRYARQVNDLVLTLKTQGSTFTFNLYFVNVSQQSLWEKLKMILFSGFGIVVWTVGVRTDSCSICLTTIFSFQLPRSLLVSIQEEAYPIILRTTQGITDYNAGIYNIASILSLLSLWFPVFVGFILVLYRKIPSCRCTYSWKTVSVYGLHGKKTGALQTL